MLSQLEVQVIHSRQFCVPGVRQPQLKRNFSSGRPQTEFHGDFASMEFEYRKRKCLRVNV